MESLAEGGGICISGTVYDQVKNKIGLEYEYLGEQSVKNVSQLVRVYRVLSFPGAAAHRVEKAKSATEKKWRNVALAIAAVLIIAAGTVVSRHVYMRPALPPEKAVALNPNGVDVNALLGLMLRCLGRAEEAVEMLEKAIRLNPIPPAWHLYNLGDAYRLARRYEEAVGSFKKAIHQNPDHLLAWIYLTATYGQMGREEEARAAADKVLRVSHKFVVEPYAKRLPYKNQDDIRSLIDALHKAGLK
jgi:tetratricopeptide (TPR) repeat protein